MFKKIVIVFIFASLYFSNAQNDNNTTYIEYDKDIIIGSFSSSIVFLIHSQLDLLKNASFEFEKQEKYYKSQLQILRIINENFSKNMNDFVIKALPSKKDKELLDKLIDFADVYKKQINLLDEYIDTKNNDKYDEFSELHEQMKVNINNLFNSKKE
jgi:1-deoxy-D-xylulose 5-phosphate reductoisomerase